ncbi:MAG: hypothetical protein ACYDCQ_15725 [Dehalococcoidia bacterium]
MTPALQRLTTVVRSLTGADLSSTRAWWAGTESHEPDDTGPRANQRLTAITGAVVLPLAAVVLLTGLFFGNVWRIHYFVGYLLLPVVLVKLGSTAYRMVRYYLRSGLYRLVRPPYPIARLTSPVLVLSVIVLFSSGIAMWLSHSRADPWGFLHTDAAVVFSGIVLLHLGMYLPEALRGAREDVRLTPPTAPSQRTRRLSVIGGAVLAGLLLALIAIGPSRIPVRSHRFRENSSQLR